MLPAHSAPSRLSASPTTSGRDARSRPTRRTAPGPFVATLIGALSLGACGGGDAKVSDWDTLCAWGKEAEAVPPGSQRARLFAEFVAKELHDPEIRALLARSAQLPPDERAVHFRTAARLAGKERCPALDVVFFDPNMAKNPLVP